MPWRCMPLPLQASSATPVSKVRVEKNQCFHRLSQGQTQGPEALLGAATGPAIGSEGAGRAVCFPQGEGQAKEQGVPPAAGLGSSAPPSSWRVPATSALPLKMSPAPSRPAGPHSPRRSAQATRGRVGPGYGNPVRPKKTFEKASKGRRYLFGLSLGAPRHAAPRAQSLGRAGGAGPDQPNTPPWPAAV